MAFLMAKVLTEFFHRWKPTFKMAQQVVSRQTSDKGQLISKGLFCVFNSSKKRTKNLCPGRLGQKLKFSSSFFGRIEDTKKTFRN